MNGETKKALQSSKAIEILSLRGSLTQFFEIERKRAQAKFSLKRIQMLATYQLF